MRLPLVGSVDHARRARPVWTARMAVAGAAFIVIGVALAVGTMFANPSRNVDVLSAGVTLAVAGGVLRSISTPARN